MLNIVKIHINGDCAVSIKAIPLQLKNKPRQKRNEIEVYIINDVILPV